MLVHYPEAGKSEGDFIIRDPKSVHSEPITRKLLTSDAQYCPRIMHVYKQNPNYENLWAVMHDNARPRVNACD